MGSGLYLRIGLLIIGGTILFVGLIWFLGGTQLTHGLLFESYFSESVQGLEVGAAVKYRGVTLGRVTDIGLVAAEYGLDQPIDVESKLYRLVFVRCIIDADKLGRVPDSQEAVREGLRSRLASQGITGLSYIELDFVNPKDYPPLQVPWTPKVTYIPSMPSTLAHLQDSAEQVLSKLNQLDLEKLTSEFTGLATDLRTSLAQGDIHDLLGQATATLKTAQDAIRDADLPRLAGDLERTSTSLRNLVQSRDTQRLLANGALAAERLATASEKLPGLIASIQATARSANNSVADVQRSLVPVLRDIEAMAANLREVTQALRRSPAEALFGTPPPRTTGPVR